MSDERGIMFRKYLLFSLLIVALGADLAYSQATVTIFGGVSDCSGAVVPGVQVTATNKTSSVSFNASTDAIGNFRIGNLPPGIYDVSMGPTTQTVDLRVNDIVQLKLGCPATAGIVFAATRSGPEARIAFTLRLPAGQCPHPNPAFDASACINTGDTLPVGPDEQYALGIFDTGSTVLLLNNLPPTESDAKALGLCSPDGNCQTPSDPHLPPKLDVRIWGLGATNSSSFALPMNNPQAQVQGIKVRPYSTPTLIGAPVAAKVVAEINYKKIVARHFNPEPSYDLNGDGYIDSLDLQVIADAILNKIYDSRFDLNADGSLNALDLQMLSNVLSKVILGGLVVGESPDIIFYPQGGTGIPTPTFELALQEIGSFGTSGNDQASKGPQYLAKNVTFSKNGLSVVDTSSIRFLYDTGNTTTQVTTNVATMLGINPDTDTPDDTYTINTTTGTEVVKGFLIDNFEVTATDGTQKYTIPHPLIYVRSSLGGPNGNIGSNYFANAHVLFNGPGDSLGIIEADGTIPGSGGTVADDVYGSKAEITFPAGDLGNPTEVTISVLSSAPSVPTPSGYGGTGTYFVRIDLNPEPSFPLPAPGATLVLPLLNAMTPGSPIPLFRMDPSSGTLVPVASVSGGNVIGSVDSGGLTATFTGIASFSTLVGLVPRLGDLNGDGKIDCLDLAVIKAAFGKRAGQSGFDPRADVNHDGVVDVRDLSIVSRLVPAGTKCP